MMTTAFGMENLQKTSTKTIIIGFDDLLFEPNPVGASNFGWLASLLENWSLETGQKKLIDMVEKAQENNDDTYKEFATSFKHPALFRGTQLPFLWCLYLTGFISNEDILRITKNSIEKNTSFFEKPLKPVLNYIADTAFIPKYEAAIMAEKRDVIQIMQKLSQQENIQLVILANKRYETMKILEEKFPEIFSLFKKIYVSETIKNLKPNKETYEYVLSDLKIEIAQCFIIECELEYLNTAKNLGIESLYFDGNCKNFEQLLHEKKLLDSLDIILREPTNK